MIGRNGYDNIGKENKMSNKTRPSVNYFYENFIRYQALDTNKIF